jgi:hypothetical protein
LFFVQYTGTEITLTITPAANYRLEEGSLKYSGDGDGDVAVNGIKFLLPAANVTVTAKFVTATPAELVEAGTQALVDKNFNAAITAFESAYQGDKSNKEALVYSSLAKLASIATDGNVRKLVMDRLGFINYPGTIDALITSDWMKAYTHEEIVYWYYDESANKDYEWYDPQNGWDAKFLKRYGLELKAGYYYQEPLQTIEYKLVSSVRKTGDLDWYYDNDVGTSLTWQESNPGGTGWTGPGYYWSAWLTYHFGSGTVRYDSRIEKMPGLSEPDWFKNSGVYKDNLTSAGALQASQWPLLFYANLVEKNQNGLNDLLGDVLSSVFGEAFEDAAGRYKDLQYSESVVVDEQLIEAFGLTDVFEGDDIYIGKAELDLLFSAVRLFKASLEWVAAYDWNTDVSFLRTDWKTIDDNIATLSPKNLPLGNNFLKDRNNGMMDKSKADFVKALEVSIAAYDHLVSAESKLPGAYIDEMKNYQWLKDGLSQLSAAITAGGEFYVPKDEPSGNSYNNTSANAAFGISLGKLFNPGQFSIEQLIETEGNAPKFYAFGDGDPTPVTEANLDSLNEGHFGFRLKLGRLKEVVVAGWDEFGPEGETQDMPLFPAKIGKDLFKLYHK